MSSQIFIAYTEGDRQTAEGVCATLEKAAMRGWLISRDVPAGSDTRMETLESLDSSAACVLILSPHTETSYALIEQVNRARERKLPLIALRMSQPLLSPSLQETLESALSVAADLPPTEAQLALLVQTVKTALPRTSLDKRPLSMEPALPKSDAVPLKSEASPRLSPEGSDFDLPASVPPLPTVPAAPAVSSNTAPGFQNVPPVTSPVPPPLPSGSYNPAMPPPLPAGVSPSGGYAPAPASSGVPYRAAGWQSPGEPFRPVAALSQCVLVLLSASILLDCIGTIFGLSQARLISRMASSGGFSMAEVTANDHRMQILGILQIVLLVAAAVGVVTWIYRAYKNLAAFGVQGTTLSPGLAAGSFFIPFYNLAGPFMAMTELWRASDPQILDSNPYAWKTRRVSGLVGCWWTFWILGNIAGWISFQSIAGTKTNFEHDALFSSLLAGSWGLVASDGLSIFAGLLLVIIVLTISRWQELRGRHLAAQRGLQPAVSSGALYPVLTAVGLMLLLGTTGAVVAGFQSQGTAWKEFTSPGGEFTARMPGSPTLQTETEGTTTITLYLSSDGENQYISSYFDIAVSGPVTNPKEVMEAFKKSKAEGLHGTLAEEHDITVGSQPGKEFSILNPQGAGVQDTRIRVFIVGNRFFQFMVMGEKTALHSPEADQFFQSIHVPGM